MSERTYVACEAEPGDLDPEGALTPEEDARVCRWYNDRVAGVVAGVLEIDPDRVVLTTFGNMTTLARVIGGVPLLRPYIGPDVFEFVGDALMGLAESIPYELWEGQ